MSEMTIKTPQTLEELKRYISNADDNTYILAGGTDFIIKMNKKNIYEGTIIDLTGISKLNYITKEDDFIKIGANTTFTDISESSIINSYATCVAQAASMIGSTQIRNCATIAGNVANASQAADCIPALICLNAKAKIMNGEGIFIEKSIEELVLGINKNSLKKDEVIVEILIPIRNINYKSAFSKIGSRSSVTISKLNMAVSLKLGKVIEEVSIVIGSLGEKAFHSTICEEILVNKEVNTELFESFKEKLKYQVDLAIPNRKSKEYKREAILGICDEIIGKLFESSIGGNSRDR
ncbi:FAD binding domain-containing protein [Clostridiaceae bacterium UIB06]|uniref:FAD binding domain-containing protein n=1 Tax=Clostridium thailandense TaxID=2794346 RepID=A0A949U1K5_9CLOT|nr:FAD binding domain-containing protein [Clostridium thailandense]MBV7274783.1 FAD binding domain-containing protein [Clostridium thailandense]MCH5137244.1 FAD binding domain-containing protein [Clostridiaceae bacterium UIB06]